MVHVAIPVRVVGLPKNKTKIGQHVWQLYISRIWGADPTKPIVIIFGTSRELADVINCAKFHIDRSRGYGGAGVQKSHVPMGKRSRPQYCIALPCMM
jgi:hypothetical protein